MARPLSPIHAPLDPETTTGPVDTPNPMAYPPPGAPPPHARITRLAELDMRVLAGRMHKLGPGAASLVFAEAVKKALVEETRDQLLGKDASDSEMGRWAADIIDAFREE